MSKLDKARNDIEQIDKEIAKLFTRRMIAVEDVAKFKIENNKPVFDPIREKELINRNTGYVDVKYKKFYKDFLIDMFRVSKEYQKKLLGENKVGFQGVDGSFTLIALNKIFDKKIIETVSYSSFGAVFDAVKNGDITYGVVPFENSHAGEVGDVVDLLYSNNLFISEFYTLTINQCLLGVPGAKVEELTKVYTHPQAYMQSTKFFKNREYIEFVPHQNTATAAKFVSETNDIHFGAIGSIETAKIYNLEVLEKCINNDRHNYTKFIVIQRDEPVDGNRISVVFTVSHETGALADVVNIIKEYNINMESLKSRARKNKAWEYYFYAELVVDYIDAQQLLTKLRNTCKKFKIVGIYSKL